MSEGQGLEGDHGSETVEVSNVGDIVISVLSTIGGLLIAWYAFGLPPAPGGGPGPGLFPSIIGAFLTVIGLILGSMAFFRMQRVRSLKRAGPERAMEGEDATATSSVQVDRDGNHNGNSHSLSGWSNVIAVLAAIVFYIALVETLGFIITMSVLQLALMLKFKRGILSAIVISLVSTFTLYLVFDRILFIPLQDGLLG